MNINDFSELMITLNLGAEQLNSLSKETDFFSRFRLVKPLDILYALCTESTGGAASCNDIAAKIEAGSGESVSRQAIWKKMSEQAVMYFKRVLEHVILTKINGTEIEEMKLLGHYKRLLVQDSTVIYLPSKLFKLFSGVSNGHSQVCNARIQGVYDLLSGCFVSFSIDSYSKNDFVAASELCLEKHDLTLRDRGYYLVDEIKRHLDNGADCIYRYKNNVTLLDPTTHAQLNLLEMLLANNNLDTYVALNNSEHTIVRIVAAPVGEQIANLRRMKAKKEMKNIPSEIYLKLLSWSIYVTTIPKEVADYSWIMKTYALRWRIEIIFKCWKSNMAFSKIHNVSKTQLHIILCARFIMITICIQTVFHPCKRYIQKHFSKHVSILKLTRYLMKNMAKIVELVSFLYKKINDSCPKIMSSIARYCTYCKRKRLNFEREWELLMTLS